MYNEEEADKEAGGEGDERRTPAAAEEEEEEEEEEDDAEDIAGEAPVAEEEEVDEYMIAEEIDSDTKPRLSNEEGVGEEKAALVLLELRAVRSTTYYAIIREEQSETDIAFDKIENRMNEKRNENE